MHSNAYYMEEREPLLELLKIVINQSYKIKGKCTYVDLQISCQVRMWHLQIHAEGKKPWCLDTVSQYSVICVLYYAPKFSS